MKILNRLVIILICALIFVACDKADDIAPSVQTTEQQIPTLPDLSVLNSPCDSELMDSCLLAAIQSFTCRINPDLELIVICSELKQLRDALAWGLTYETRPATEEDIANVGLEKNPDGYYFAIDNAVLEDAIIIKQEVGQYNLIINQFE